MDKFKAYIRRLRRKHVSFVFTWNRARRPVVVRLSFFRCYVFGLAFLVFAGVFFSVSVVYAGRKEKLARLAYLTKRAELRAARIAEINAARAKIQTRVASYAAFDDDLRIAQDLPPIAADVRKAGVGGPLTNLTHILKVGRDKNVDELELSLRQAQLQRDSFAALLEAQARAKFIFNHTPSVKPCAGPIVSGFCWRRNPIFGGVQFHKGLDIAVPTGTPIIAPADGTVTFAGMKTGYGYCVFIKHAYGFETRYGHCSQLMVVEGQQVRRGDIIALVGATGWAVGPHLHYEVLVGGNHVDPGQYILPDYLTD